MAKNSQKTPVKLTQFYRNEYEGRVCCWCKSALDDSGLGQPKVSCSKECYSLARSYAQKSLRHMNCQICDEELPANRTSQTRLCGREGCRKEAAWRRNIYRRHHIRTDQFYKLAEDQNWCCAICKEDLVFSVDGSKNHINIDHDHSCCPGRISCGRCVRGILCNGCNGGTGLFKDNPESLISAAQYLLNYKKRVENSNG